MVEDLLESRLGSGWRAVKKIDKVPMQASLRSAAGSKGSPEVGLRKDACGVSAPGCMHWMQPHTPSQVDERKCLMAQAGDRF